MILKTMFSLRSIAKGLNMSITYSNNICLKYKGKDLVLSNATMRESMKYGLDIEDCKTILEEGYIGRQRASGTEEKWFNVGKKIYNVVVVKEYNYTEQKPIYLITHIGRFTKK